MSAASKKRRRVARRGILIRRVLAELKWLDPVTPAERFADLVRRGASIHTDPETAAAIARCTELAALHVVPNGYVEKGVLIAFAPPALPPLFFPVLPIYQAPEPRLDGLAWYGTMRVTSDAKRDR